jgi:hypothetical protein
MTTKTPPSGTAHFIITFSTALATGLLALSAQAGFSTPGQGVSNVFAGTVNNGALFWGTTPTWTNNTPALPCTTTTGFALPACDRVVKSRLLMTVWGGTANYTCQMNATVNGASLPGVNPLVFGTTGDANPVFTENAPCAYGAGSGLWLVALPVPPDMLHTDGSSNIVNVTVTTPDSFDGRLHHVTLVAVYQSSSLTNQFDYALAEGSGDIYGNPTVPQVNQRAVMFGADPTNATAATLTALYTYGDTGQNDRLLFTGTQLGGNDIAQWDKTGTGLNYGPSVVSFDVLANLATTNALRFAVAAADVPGTRETSLRPQLTVLTVTRPPAGPSLAIALNVTIAWPASADTYQLQFRPNADSGSWVDVTNTPVVIDGQNTVILPRTSPQQFYQLRKTN